MLTFECPKWIIKEFKRIAKEAFPKEVMSYIYGQIYGNTMVAEGIWTPDNILDYCEHSIIHIQPEWAVQAIDEAKEEDCVVFANIHSHPFTKEELAIYTITGNHQSESDIDSCGLAWQQLSGICVIKESKTGKLRSSIRFWGPTIPLEVRIK